MSAVRTAFLATALAALLALAVCAPAGATVRYASPTGGIVEPCNPTACSLVKAVGGAKAGDQVILAPGSYTSASDLTLDKAIDVGGQVGAAASVAFSGDKAAIVESGGAVLHDLTLSHTTGTMQYALVLKSGTVERVYVDGRKGSSCFMAEGLLRDSACFEGIFVHASDPGAHAATLANVAANPLTVGAGAGAKLNVTLLNSIALAGDGGPGDLEIDSSAGGTTAVVAVNSSYAGVDTSLSSGTDFTYTPAGSGGNITAPPRLVDPANGDFQPLAGSPTVDAGAQTGSLGPFDLAGVSRSLPRCIGGVAVPDIGPYEFVPTADCPSSPPPAAEPSAQSPPVAGSLGFGKLTRNPKNGTARLPVVLSSAGILKLKGKGVIGREVGASRSLTLVIRAKGVKLAKLKRDGKVKIRLKLVFTPKGGAPVTVFRPVTLKLALG